MLQPIEIAADRLSLGQIRAMDLALDAKVARDHTGHRLKPNVSSAGGVAVAGLDGYLFIGSGNNRWEQQYLGELTIMPAWFTQWSDVFQRRSAEAAARGVTLVNFVAPEKQVLLPEKRWDDLAPQGELRPLRRLVDALPAGAIVYPEPEMLAAKDDGLLFHRRNSHWTATGCLIAAGAIFERLGIVPPTGPLYAAKQTVHHHDLSAHFFESPAAEEMLLLAAPGRIVDRGHVGIAGQQTGSTYRIINEAAQDPRKLVLCGDSYAYDAGLAAALAAVFRDVTVVWSKSVQWEWAAARGAEVIVWESAERFLIEVSAA